MYEKNHFGQITRISGKEFQKIVLFSFNKKFDQSLTIIANNNIMK